MCFEALKGLFQSSGTEKLSPSDLIREEAFSYEQSTGLLVIDLKKNNIPFLENPPKVWIPYIPDTNSMDGVFDYGNNNILIAGQTPQDHARIVDAIQVGDIAVYRTASTYAIHRVVDIAPDTEGKLHYRFKGDNCSGWDPDVVFAENIEWLSIGTIY